MKVKVKEYVQTIYELPDDYFDKLINDDMSDCEIAYEFKTKGKEIFQDSSYDENPISWDINKENEDES